MERRLKPKIGSPAKAGQIGGNLNTMIMLRVKTVETAEMLTNQLPEVKIMTSTLVSRAGDVAYPDSHEDFSSGNEDRIGAETVPMLTPADLTQLPKGQAFALIEGGQLYKNTASFTQKGQAGENPCTYWRNGG